MSSLTSLSYDDDEQMKEETLSRPSQACCFPFTRVASLPERRMYEMRGLRVYVFFCNFEVGCFYTFTLYTHTYYRGVQPGLLSSVLEDA